MQYQGSAIRWQCLFMANYCKTTAWQLSGHRGWSGQPYVSLPSKEVVKVGALMVIKKTERLSLFHTCRKEIDIVF